MSDERIERQIESLFASFGAVMQVQERLTERIDYAAEDRKRLREAAAEDRRVIREEVRELRVELLAAIAEVDEECKQFRVKVEKWREEDEKARRTALEGRVSNRTIVLAMIAGSATVFAAIIAAAATIITGG